MTSQKQGTLIIISSPSGAGKTTITKKLLDHYQEDLSLSVSITTRNKRQGETDGKDYFFISAEKFSSLAENYQLLEYARVFDNFYGTPKQFVLDVINQGKNIVFDIDWQGARQVTKHQDLNIVTIFILPPSLQALEERLHKRGLDSRKIIENRMKKAKDEINHYNEYDFVVVNNNIEETTEKIRKIIDFYSLSYIKAVDYKNFVEQKLK